MSIFSSTTLKGKRALITGATGGIGYETAKVVASMGAAVTITGRKENVLKELKADIENETPHAKVFYYLADLANADEREQLIQASEEKMGPVSLLVNSAGITGGGVIEDLTQDELERIMHLNFTVPILLTQRLYESMKDNKDGAIVNVSSLSGIRGTFAGTAYVGSKFALNGFTQSFALEAIQHNIRVNAVCPGYVETKMGLDSIGRKAERENSTFEEQYKIESDKLPSGRITNAKEVANTIAFLLSDAAENIVGESVKLSGGSVM